MRGVRPLTIPVIPRSPSTSLRTGSAAREPFGRDAGDGSAPRLGKGSLAALGMTGEGKARRIGAAPNRYFVSAAGAAELGEEPSATSGAGAEAAGPVRFSFRRNLATSAFMTYWSRFRHMELW